MRMGKWARLLLATAPLMAGCGDFWQAPSGSTTTTSTCTAAVTPTTTVTAPTSSSGNFYVLNNITGTTFQVVGYSIVSGTLTPLTSPAALNGQAYSMAIDPNNGHFLFVSSSNGIFLYTISGGALTLESNTAVIPDALAYAIRVDPSGQWLLDASNTGAALYAYPINSSTGVSTLAGGVTVPSKPFLSGGSVSLGGMAVSPDNNLVSVAEGSAGTQTFTFTAGSGNTGSTSPFGSTVYTTSPKGTAAISVAYSPQNSFLFIGETAVFTCSSNSGGLRMIPIASDVPGTEPSASPYPSGGTSPHAILVPMATSGYVYVANWQGASSGNITGFLVTSGASPALTMQSSTVATGAEPLGMVEDSTSGFVLAASSLGATTFDAYTFDTTITGQLDTAITGTTGIGPVAIVAAP